LAAVKGPLAESLVTATMLAPSVQGGPPLKETVQDVNLKPSARTANGKERSRRAEKGAL